jgi:hypothetical protein
MTTAESPFNELQKQLYVALNGVISAPVYDHVPENKSKPWVTIGEVFGTPDNWHGGFGWDIMATLHAWSKSRGFKPALDVANEIIPILDHQRDSLAIPNPWYIVSLRFVQLQTLLDPDPEIRHVPVQFQVVIHQEV